MQQSDSLADGCRKAAPELTPEMSAKSNELRRKVMAGRGRKKWQKKLRERWERPVTPEYEDTDMVYALKERQESEAAAKTKGGAAESEREEYSDSDEGDEVEVFRFLPRSKVLERGVTTQKKKRPPDPRVMRQQQLMEQLSLLEDAGSAGALTGTLTEETSGVLALADAAAAADAAEAAAAEAEAEERDEEEEEACRLAAEEAERRLPRVRALRDLSLQRADGTASSIPAGTILVLTHGHQPGKYVRGYQEGHPETAGSFTPTVIRLHVVSEEQIVPLTPAHVEDKPQDPLSAGRVSVVDAIRRQVKVSVAINGQSRPPARSRASASVGEGSRPAPPPPAVGQLPADGSADSPDGSADAPLLSARQDPQPAARPPSVSATRSLSVSASHWSAESWVAQSAMAASDAATDFDAANEMPMFELVIPQDRPGGQRRGSAGSDSVWSAESWGDHSAQSARSGRSSARGALRSEACVPSERSERSAGSMMKGFAESEAGPALSAQPASEGAVSRTSSAATAKEQLFADVMSRAELALGPMAGRRESGRGSAPESRRPAVPPSAPPRRAASAGMGLADARSFEAAAEPEAGRARSDAESEASPEPEPELEQEAGVGPEPEPDGTPQRRGKTKKGSKRPGIHRTAWRSVTPTSPLHALSIRWLLPVLAAYPVIWNSYFDCTRIIVLESHESQSM